MIKMDMIKMVTIILVSTNKDIIDMVNFKIMEVWIDVKTQEK